MSESLSILIVDDNYSMARSLADVLDVKGYEVYAVHSGTEALEILREHPVDILITDVIMPKMNGVALYQETRKTHPRLTTFFMTAYAADDLIQEGMKAGIKMVLTKPLNIDFLIDIFSATKRISSKSR